MAFHVPEQARVRGGPLGSTALDDGNNGAFALPSREPGWVLLIIASDGTVLPDEDDEEARRWEGWEHVSVQASTRDGRVRTPSWDEMCQVKDLFWGPEDVVMQLHPRASRYVNCHPYVLHLWRHSTERIPEPPSDLVGPQQAVS